MVVHAEGTRSRPVQQ